MHWPPVASITPPTFTLSLRPFACWRIRPADGRRPARNRTAIEVHGTMSSNDPTGLKLIALDTEDLDVVSAHLQDAVINVGEMAYLKRERRFAAIANRFDWSEALSPSRSARGPFTRRRSGLRIEQVLGAQLTGIDLADKRQALSVLAVRFEPTTAPEGYLTIACAGNAAIRLHVECLEAELKDLGAAWATKSKPEHPDDEPDATG